MDDKKKKRFLTEDIRRNSNRFCYPYSERPVDTHGNNFLDIAPDMLGEDLFFSDTDPGGSYTGVPQDVDETPVQDADDL